MSRASTTPRTSFESRVHIESRVQTQAVSPQARSATGGSSNAAASHAVEAECKEEKEVEYMINEMVQTNVQTIQKSRRVRTKRKGYLRKLNYARLVSMKHPEAAASHAPDPMKNMKFLPAAIGDKYVGRKFQVLSNGSVVVSYEPSKYADIVLKYDVGDAATISPVRCHVRCARSDLFRTRSEYFEALLTQVPKNESEVTTETYTSAAGASSARMNIRKTHLSPSIRPLDEDEDEDDKEKDATGGSTPVFHAGASISSVSSSESADLPHLPSALGLNNVQKEQSLPYAAVPVSPGTFATVEHLIMFFDWILLDDRSSQVQSASPMEVRPSQVCSGNLSTQTELYRLAGLFLCPARARDDIEKNSAYLLDALSPIERLEWGIHFEVPSFRRSGAMAIFDANLSATLTDLQTKACVPYWQENHLKQCKL
jgi:hypothetical protein